MSYYCPDGYELENTMCYKPCDANYQSNGNLCIPINTCPQSSQNNGPPWPQATINGTIYCGKPTEGYSRGAGYPWKFGDGLNLDDATKRCEADHGVGNCEQWGLVIYPKCASGYTNNLCCECTNNDLYEDAGNYSYLSQTGMIYNSDVTWQATDWYPFNTKTYERSGFPAAKIPDSGCPGTPPCSGNGTCSQGICICNEGYSGKDCSISNTKNCPGVPPCSNNGKCVNGVCVCNEGYGGKDCFEKITPGKCPGNPVCSGNGTCQNNICVCNSGYSGYDCSIKYVCSKNNCTNGTCTNGTCVCNPGFKGTDCSTPTNKTCKESSECKNGNCVNGICICNLGYSGTDCSQLIVPGQWGNWQIYLSIILGIIIFGFLIFLIYRLIKYYNSK